jgi:alpha-beta hydrolase superfamily lysophospholipase
VNWLVKTATALAIAAPASAGSAAALAGRWAGQLSAHGQSIPIGVEYTHHGSAESGRFTSQTQAVMDYPFDSVTYNHGHVIFILGGQVKFDGAIHGRAIEGSYRDPSVQGAFALHRVPPERLPYRTEDVTFTNGDVRLSGTLCLPPGKAPHPGVVLIHGSGPESRWGTIRHIADRFARAGIAVLIYDKRGSGESGGDWRTASYDDLAHDVLAGVRLLARTPGVDSRRIGLLGHSQGGAVAPLVAKLDRSAIAFVVAEDTFAGPQWQQDIYRVSEAAKGLKLSSAEYKDAVDTYTSFVDSARGAIPYEQFASRAAKYKDASWYSWMAFPPRNSWVWGWAAKNSNFDPLPLWANVMAPTLLVYGEEDNLQPRDPTIRLIETKLDHSGARYSAIIVPDAQHNLTVQPDPDGPFFWWHEARGLLDVIAAWIARQPARG